MAEHVTIFEVSPRDGLQNEPRPIATRDKIRLVDLLSECGFEKIEVTSFVSPTAVPQMGDAHEVFAGIKKNPGIAYAALTPNLQGYRSAKQAGADEVAIFASASEGFSQKNINCSIAESFDRFAPVMKAAAHDGMRVRGYVSCICQCPYDGAVPPSSVANVAAKLISMGCYEISLGDTIGAGTPEIVDAAIKAVLDVAPTHALAGHFHNTNGRALENIDVCLGHGIRVYDASAGGLGGCPFAPGARGNVATEHVADLLVRRGYATGLDLKKLKEAAAFAQSLRTRS